MRGNSSVTHPAELIRETIRRVVPYEGHHLCKAMTFNVRCFAYGYLSSLRDIT
jgi:hypothetical protein